MLLLGRERERDDVRKTGGGGGGGHGKRKIQLCFYSVDALRVPHPSRQEPTRDLPAWLSQQAFERVCKETEQCASV